MDSYACNPHHRWGTQAAWTNKIYLCDIGEKYVYIPNHAFFGGMPWTIKYYFQTGRSHLGKIEETLQFPPYINDQTFFISLQNYDRPMSTQFQNIKNIIFQHRSSLNLFYNNILTVTIHQYILLVCPD